MTRPLPHLPGTLTADQIRITGEHIAGQQLASGLIPWFRGHHGDPWDHIESSMGLSISGYYKDVKNLVEAADFTSNTGLTYSSYYNRDNADIRGFRIALTKKSGFVSGSINYQYSVATGKSATADYAPPSFRQDSLGNVTTINDKVPLKDVLLGFDRTNNLTINLVFDSDELLIFFL